MYYDDCNLKNSIKLKEESRINLKDNWIKAILVCLICWILTSSLSYTANLSNSAVQQFNMNFPINPHSMTIRISQILSFLIGGPLTLGSSFFFLKLARKQPIAVGDLSFGFKHFLNAFLLQLISTIFITLWTLLLIIPGIIAALRYSMAYYIMSDDPEISALEAIKKSSKIMKGNKGRLFFLILSFIGWLFVGIITLGIGFLWISPYFYASHANFYENLKNTYEYRNSYF